MPRRRQLALLLLILLPAFFGYTGGVAGGADSKAASERSASSIGAPRQSLPVPVHDEATCAFCQAALFPPCAPAPLPVAADLPHVVAERFLSLEARFPHSSARQPANSRAPPTLRIA